MQHYLNLGGTSEVYACEIECNSIKVQFKDGSFYLYS